MAQFVWFLPPMKTGLGSLFPVHSHHAVVNEHPRKVPHLWHGLSYKQLNTSQTCVLDLNPEGCWIWQFRRLLDAQTPECPGASSSSSTCGPSASCQSASQEAEGDGSFTSVPPTLVEDQTEFQAPDMGLAHATFHRNLESEPASRINQLINQSLCLSEKNLKVKKVLISSFMLKYQVLIIRALRPRQVNIQNTNSS